MRRQLRFAIGGIGADDQNVSNGSLARGRSVERYLARVALPLDGVSAESLAIRNVVDLNVLVGQNPREFEKFLVDAARTLVVKASLRDSNSMEFGLKHCPVQLAPPVLLLFSFAVTADAPTASGAWPCLARLTIR